MNYEEPLLNSETNQKNSVSFKKKIVVAGLAAAAMAGTCVALGQTTAPAVDTTEMISTAPAAAEDFTALATIQTAQGYVSKMQELSKIAKNCNNISAFTDAVGTISDFGAEFGAISGVLMIGAQLLGAKSTS